MRVLVVRLGAFGDMVHTLPLAATLAQAGHEVGWLCEDRWSELVVGNPAIALVHQLPRAQIRKGPWFGRLAALQRTVADLRRGVYDAVIDAQGLAKSAFFAVASGARQRIGHAPCFDGSQGRSRAREGSWLVMRTRIPTTDIHVIDQQRNLAQGLGLAPTGPWRFPLPRWQEAEVWLATALPPGPRPWVLNVGAGWPTKLWPQERQVALVQALQRRRQRVLLLWGSPAERTAAERVLQLAGSGELAPPTTIPRLGALLRASRLLVSSDTGPLQLGFAIGSPCVGLFGPVPALRNGPCGAGQRSLQAPGKRWERKDLSLVDMGAISVEAVLEAGDAALAEADARMRPPASGSVLA